jgi:uncharacterized protein (TIGR02147 family)
MTLFEYDNYRKFLQDFLNEQKKSKKGFSLRSFTKRCGFSSHAFLANVLKGERNLRVNSIGKLMQGLNLGDGESSYFKTLVFYNQAETAEDRKKYLTELQQIRGNSGYVKIIQDQWEYYSRWYLPVLRELAPLKHWMGNYKVLAKSVRPTISEKEAKEGIALLVRIKLLKKLAGERFALADDLVSAEGVPGVIFREARTQYMLRGIEAAENLGPDVRHASYAVIGTSKKAYERISQKMTELRLEIINSFATDNDVECVYAINFQAFPVSQLGLLDIQKPTQK